MTKVWSNWAGSEQCQPSEYVQAENARQISDLVIQSRQKGRKIRPLGSGHSFSPLVPTEQTLLSLDRLDGIAQIAADRKSASVMAGTRLKRLGQLLYEEGLSQENLGDIDAQAIAGALSTGTHGTGASFGTLSTQIEGMELVDGQGQIHWLDPQHQPEVFSAARIALGSLGVITQLKLRVEDAYKLEFISGKESLESVLKNYERYLRENRNYEFYWFPYSGMVQNKFSNKSNKLAIKSGVKEYINDIILENYIFKFLSEIARIFPSTCESIARISAMAVSASSKVNWSHQVYATARLVRFNEMEYNVPRKAFSDVMRQLQERVEKERFRVHFPVECRFVAPDDIPLSPAYQRESAYLAVHMYKGMPYQEYFDAAEEIFLAHEGRPHWGKMHSLSAAQLAPRYPRWDEFMKIRQRMDPDGVFLNPYLEKLFGLSTNSATSGQSAASGLANAKS